jgi:predicted Zn-dependent protease with MMP-like domain
VSISVKVVEETLDSLPREFRSRIRNVAVLVENLPPNQPSPPHRKRLLLGLFHSVPMTKKGTFDLPAGPDHVVLYQKNIEAVCFTEVEVRRQSVLRSCMNWVTISAWMRSNARTFSETDSGLCVWF